MAQILKYVIGKDYRPLTVLEAKGGNTFTPDYDKSNWVQARQYEDSLRQVFVEITNEDGSAYDLTGANVLFEGILPDNEHKILDNSHVVFYEDPTTGKFRFDMPAQAFSVAGQYKQAFFRVVKDYRNIATLEFKFEVLADMVITGLVPRDYISPLEDLFNTIKEAETKNVAELKKIVDEKINEITDLMTTLNQTNTATLSELNSAKTALEALDDKIKQDGLFTQGEAEELKNSVKELAENLKAEVKESLVDTTRESYIATSYNGADKYSASVDLVNSLNPDLKIALMSDPHFMYQVDKDGGNSANRFKEFAEISDKVDADIIIMNGDSIDGATVDWYNDFNDWQHKEIGFATNETAINLVEGYKKTQTPIFWILGNHDHLVRKNVGYDTPKSTLSNTEMKELYHTNNVYNEVRDNGSFYFYKDFENKKIRVIGLNSEDSTDELNSDGTWKNKDINIHLMQQRQLDWLANTALKVDDDWHVVIFYHTPVNNAFRAQGNLINSEVLKKIISNFINGKSETITTTGDYPVNVTTNFSKPGNLVGIFNGHYHRDAIDRDTIVGVTMVCQDSATPANHDNRTGNNENVFDIVCIDRNSKNVKMVRFGGGQNQEFTY